MKNFEIGDADDVESVVKSTQKAILASMEEVLTSLKNQFGGTGLTWEQLNFLLAVYKKKEPRIYIQEHDA